LKPDALDGNKLPSSEGPIASQMTSWAIKGWSNGEFFLKHAGLFLALCLSHSPVNAQGIQGAHVSMALSE